MYCWLMARGLRFVVERLMRGQPRLALAMLDQDIRMVFPGQNSFGGVHAGKPAMRAWLERFVALRPDYRVHDVVVNGPPWNTRAAIRLSDAIGDDYTNEGVQWLQLRWGKVVLDEVFLDTERISAWESRHPEITKAG